MLGAVHAGRAPRLTGPYTERDPFHDPFEMFAYLAGTTERIGFATGVLILPQRQTALVARQASDIELLSRGRLRLGVRDSWSPVVYEALGQDFRSRGARQEEQIELLRRLFTEPVVDFAGRFDPLTELRWCRSRRTWSRSGLAGPVKAFDRADWLDDGLIFFGGGIDHAVDAWHRVTDLVPGHGRSADGFGGEYAVLPWGESGELTAEVDAWEGAGGTHPSIVTMGMGLDSVDGHIDLLSTLADAFCWP